MIHPRQTLEEIAVARYATLNNLASYTTSLWGSRRTVKRNLTSLLENGLIRKLTPNMRPVEPAREEFYAVTQAGANELGEPELASKIWQKSNAPEDRYHESAKVDVVIAFHRLYGASISYEPVRFEHGKEVYRPDATIKIGKCTYYLEVETKYTKDHCKIVQKMQECLTYPIGKAQILLVYAPTFSNPQTFNVTQRPYLSAKNNEVDESLFRGHFRGFMGLLDKKKISHGAFRILPFIDFYRLNEVVWHNCRGERGKLINS